MVEAWNINKTPSGLADDFENVHDRLAKSKLETLEKENRYVDQQIDDLKKQIGKGLLNLSKLEDLYNQMKDFEVRDFLKSEIAKFRNQKNTDNEKDKKIADYKSVFREMTIPDLKELRVSLDAQSDDLKSNPDYAYQSIALDLVLTQKLKSQTSPERKFIANYEKKVYDFELFQTNLQEVIKDFENKIKDLDKKTNKGKGFWNRLFQKTKKEDEDTFDYYKKVVLEPLKNDLLLVYRDYIKVSNQEPEKEDVWLRDLNKKKDISDLEIFNLQTNKLLNAFNFSIYKERGNPELPKDIEVEEIKNFWKQIAIQRMDSRPLSDSDFSFNFPTLLKSYNIVQWGDVIDASMVVWYLHNHPSLAEDFSQYKKYKLMSLQKMQIDNEVDAQSKGFASYKDMLMFDSHANKLLEQKINRQRVEVGERPVTSSLKREDDVDVKGDLAQVLDLGMQIKIFKI